MFPSKGGHLAFEKVDQLTFSIIGDIGSNEHFDVRYLGVLIVLPLHIVHLSPRHHVLFFVIVILVLVLSAVSLMK